MITIIDFNYIIFLYLNSQPSLNHKKQILFQKFIIKSESLPFFNNSFLKYYSLLFQSFMDHHQLSKQGMQTQNEVKQQSEIVHQVLQNLNEDHPHDFQPHFTEQLKLTEKVEFHILQQNQTKLVDFAEKIEEPALQIPLAQYEEEMNNLNCETTQKAPIQEKDLENSMQQSFEKKIKELLRRYDIQEEEEIEEILEDLRNCEEEAFKMIKKSKREEFKKQYLSLKNSIAGEKIEENKVTLEQKLIGIFNQYSIDEEDHEDLISFFKENKIKECLPYTKKKMRKDFQLGLQKINEEYSGEKNLEPLKNIDQELVQCLKQAKVDEEDFDECIKMIKQGKVEQVSSEIKKSMRPNFIKRVHSIMGQMISKQKAVKKKILVKYSGVLRQIEFQNAQEFKKLLEMEFGIKNMTTNSIMIDGKNVEDNQKLFEKGIEGKMMQIEEKKEKFYEFHGQIDSFWVEKNISGEKIAMILLELVKKKDPEVEDICLTFLMENSECNSISCLQKDQIKFGVLRKILVDTFVNVVVYYHGENQKVFKIKASDTIYNLKQKIAEEILPIEAQSLFYENPEKILLNAEDNYKKIIEIIGMKKSWQIELKDTHTIEFYGFHSNREQNYEQFSEFFAQSEEEIKEVIKHSNFHDKDLEGLFFQKFIKYVYSGIKKRFPIQTTIDKFKQLTVSLVSKNLWMPFEEDKPITMNESFIAMYLLYNSDSKLRITLMKLIGKLIPLPMYFRTFQNILSVTNQIKKNEEMIWVLKEGITILSVGLHSQQFQTGKSSLLNQLFFTNFTMHENKHKIIQYLPFISIGVYDELFPLNIIDVPANCPDYVINDLLSCSDIIVIHSWRSIQESEKLKKQLENNYKLKVIVIIRDMKLTGQDNLRLLRQKNIESSCIQLGNLSNQQKSKSIVDLLRQQFNGFLKNMAKTKNKFDRIMQFSENQHFGKICNNIEKVVSSNNNQLLRFLDKRCFKDIEDENLRNKESEKVAESIEQGLNPLLINLLEDLQRFSYAIEISLDLFRQKLREFQSQKTSKFMKIYKLKEQVASLQQIQETKKEQYSEKVLLIHKQLLNLPEIYREQFYLLGKSYDQLVSIFDEITSEFENKIRPAIFSIELFWREIYSFLELSKGIIKQQQYDKIHDNVTRLKAKQILNNQPFQIIDGDSLKMPKQIMSQVFKPISDRCLVVTILGPQSSGKSTLLNFLFGCDFATSEGRCTRGVYGTFFKVNDSQITNFDSIFVIDTEGLFALTNDKDIKQEHREDFDSKLVLFCLAVSDAVIINVRGNLDFNTERILRICNEKLEALHKSQENKPEIIIVLNQNSTSKTEESENEFKKIRKTFNFKIAKSLSLAYIIKNYSKHQISIFAENQIMTKKTPLPHFRKETTNLLNEVLNTMKQKKTAEKMIDKIDKFQSIWTTVLAFPNLSKMKTKEESDLENKIKNWKKEKNEEINYREKSIVDEVKNQNIDEKKAIHEMESIHQKYLEEYIEEFKNKQMKKEFMGLIENEQKEIINKKDNMIMKLKYNITKNNLKKQMNREKFEGDFILKEVQNEIIREQKKNQKIYSNEEKEERFNECFEKALQKIKKSMRLNDKFKSEEDRIKNDYQLIIKSNKSSMKNYGLPKETLKFTESQWIQTNFSMMYQKLKEKLCNPLKHEQFMEYNDRPHTNILKGGQRDAKLKYFDTRRYFQKTSKNIYYIFRKAILYEAFHYRYFLTIYEEARQKYKMKNGQRDKLIAIFETINACLEIVGIKIRDFKQFVAVYEKKNQGMFQKLTQFLFGDSRISLEVEKINYKFSKVDSSQFEKINSEFLKNKSNLLDKRTIEQFYNKSTYTGDYYMKYGTNIETILEKMINWARISEMCKQELAKNGYQDKKAQTEKRYMEKSIDQKLRTQINQDLRYFNLYLPENISISKIIRKNLSELENKKNGGDRYQRKGQDIFRDIFQDAQSVKYSEKITQQEYDELTKKWNYLKYFNGRKMEQNVKITDRLSKIDQEKIIIGVVEEEYLQSNKKQFSKYKESDEISLKKQFKSGKFKQFIFIELKNLASIEKLCQEIYHIIIEAKKKWGRLETKAIGDIYRSVNMEITKFNDDLNQVSYQLTPRMMGKLHLMAIYLIQKCEIDDIFEKENQIIQNKLDSRDEELKKFLMRTSNDINQQIQQQVVSFQEKIIETFHEIIQDQKSDLLYIKTTEFNHNYDRKQIQRAIDLNIFQKDTSTEIILQYLQNPAEFITNKSEENYDEAWESIVRQFEKVNLGKILFKDLESILKQFKTNLEEIDKISEQKGTARDMFEMSGEAKQIDYYEEAKAILFNYFIDMLCDTDPQKDRICADLILKPKNKLAKLPCIEKSTEKILEKLLHENLQMTNISSFIDKFLLEQNLGKFERKIIEVYSFTIDEKRKFINDVRVIICSEKCPCCGRICGLQKEHTFHKCLYGHQMRALAGNFIINSQGKKQAFVVRCDQLEETDMMEYNGNKYTWTQFKDYWANKPVGGWHYDDISNETNPIDKKRFESAWLRAGPLYCEKNGLQYVDYTDSSRQKQSLVQNVHFIFALDESGSMSGRPWNDLIRALDQTMKKIRQFESNGGNPFVTIINFECSYRIIFERVKAKEINMNSISFGSGGTYFSPVFEAAARITQNNIANETMIFIFMTDGGAEYPSSGISRFKRIMDNHPKKFIYSGIQFGCDSSIMKNISMALNGTNIVANNFNELLSAYSNAIEVIAHKEKQSVGVMELN